MRYIFVNVIPAGSVDWKRPLTAEGQPSIRDAAMICANENLDVEWEYAGELTAQALAAYSSAVGVGRIIVGHSAEYHHGHLRAAMMAAGLDPADGRTNTICSMMALTGHVPKFNGRKGWPTFAETCAHYGIDRAGEESAEDNARCLMSVFANMQRFGLVPEPKIWRDRNG